MAIGLENFWVYSKLHQKNFWFVFKLNEFQKRFNLRTLYHHTTRYYKAK